MPHVPRSCTVNDTVSVTLPSTIPKTAGEVGHLLVLRQVLADVADRKRRVQEPAVLVSALTSVCSASCGSDQRQLVYTAPASCDS